MITKLKNPHKKNDILKILHPFVREWFLNKFKDFSLPQLYGVLEIHNENNILVSAPTGGTKTLTAFLSILNELVILADNNMLEDKIYAVYVSPLKALSADVQINLIYPLKEINEIAKKHGKKLDIRVGLRTGDTSSSERQKTLKNPCHILISTPESIAIILTTKKFKEKLRNVKYCIIDELHAVAENKRGAYLSITLERLQNLTKEKITRVGLSATIAPLDKMAQFLVGNDRDCRIADVSFNKKMDIKVLSPVPDLINVTHNNLHSNMYELMHNLIQEHRTTLIFTNTRSGTERVVHNLKEMYPKFYTENIGAHHGSLSKTTRHKVEDRLRKGELKCVVSSTSLELGIDIGFIDLVICLGSPKSIARTLQRCLPYNQEVLTSTGEYIKIGKIVEERSPIKVISYDEGKGYINNNIVKYHKYEDNKLVKIKLKCGEELLCTEEHPILTKNGWKKAKNITKTDRIAEIYDEIRFNNKPVYIYTLLPKNKIYVENRDNFFQKIIDNFRKENNLNLKEFSAKYNLPYSRLIDCRRLKGRKKSIRLDYFLKACEICNVKEGNYLKYMGYLKTQMNFRSRVPLELTENLLWLAGIVATDGCIVETKGKNTYYYRIKIGNKSRKLINESKRVMSGLGFKCHQYERIDTRTGNTVIFLECGSNLLSYLLMSLGIKCKNKTKNIDVGQPIFKLNNKLINAYLEGIFEGDGNFSKKSNNIRIFSASKKFTYNLHKLLRRLGYHNLVTKGKSKTSKMIKKLNYNEIYCINISRGKDVKRFLTRIPKIGEKAINSYKYIKLKSFKNQNFLQFENKIYWSEIVSIKKVNKKQPVYNLTLEHNPNNFLVGNIIVHNCGRSGHQLHDTVKARIIVLDRDDLVECAVMTKNIIERKIDKIHIPENALDVLAQQIYGIAISGVINIKDLFELVKKSYPYRNLSYSNFKDIIDYLSGQHISLEDRHVYAKIWYDEETGNIGKKGKLARVMYMTNIGTIPDETNIKVKVGEQIVGTIDESFLERLKKGDVFVLGGDRYIFRHAKGTIAYVNSTIDLPPTVPSWFSETLPLSFDLALEIQKFRKIMKSYLEQKRPKEEILKFIDEYLYIDELGKNAVYEYLSQQYKYLGIIPNENELLIEHFNDGLSNYVIFHSLYGRRVNDVLSRILGYTIGKLQKRDVEISINDNGFYLSGKGQKVQVKRAFDLLNSKDLRRIAELSIENSEILKRRFRHCAARSLMILRTYKGKTKRVGRQQVSSMILLNAVRRISNDFSILKEARREVLEDLMDIENTIKVIKDIEEGKIKIKEISTRIPSPFSFNIVMQGRMDMLKMEDRIEFLRKMHSLILEEIR